MQQALSSNDRMLNYYSKCIFMFDICEENIMLVCWSWKENGQQEQEEQEVMHKTKQLLAS